jgi:hypothetical protein
VKISRRAILATAAAVPVAGGLAVGGVAWSWWDRPAGAGLRALSQDEHDFVQALAEGWFPPGGEPPISGAEAELGRFFDDLVAAMGEGSRRELKLLLQALDDATWPTHGGPFRGLPLATRTEVVRSWLHHDWWIARNAASGVLVLLAEGYTIHPAVAEHLRGYFRCGFGR